MVPPEGEPVAKLRDRIRMTDGDAWDFIASRKAMQTATLNRDGSPHLTTNWFAIVDQQIELSAPASLDRRFLAQFFTNRGSVTRHPWPVRSSHRAVNNLDRHLVEPQKK